MEKPKKDIALQRQQQRNLSMPQAKVPPQAIELEKAIIGAMMIDKRGVDEVIDLLFPEVFYLPEHQEIFTAIISLFEEGDPVDIFTVVEKLKERGTLQQVGGEYALITLSNLVPTAAHIEYHSRIILQMYVKRKLIEISGEITEKSFDETVDVFDLLDDAEKKLFEVSQGSLKRGTVEISSVVTDVKAQLEQLAKQEGLSGISTGFLTLDDYTSGWQPGDLIIIAARPGMGKTAFVLSMARNMAVDHKVPVAIFNMEMTSAQLIKRLFSIETEIPADRFRSGKLSDMEWNLLNNKMDRISGAPIYVNDSSMLSIFDLRAQARRMKSQYDIGIIIIDYLQLMTAQSGNKGGTNREQEISTISRNLKALGKELGIPVIALSQLSRKVEERADKSGHKRPMLSDLRESGAIEQDADIVTFIYRPEYYKLELWEDDTPTDNQAEFIIAKHRNGKTGNIRLRFEGQFGRFSDLNMFDGGEQVMESKMNANTDISADTFSLPPDMNNIDENDFPF
jgi:replicative DNA helicase